MATDQDLNTTGSVPATGTPQTPTNTDDGSKSTDFQPTANPNTVGTKETLNVTKTGDPISGNSVLNGSSTGTYVLSAIGIAVVIGLVLLIVRIKNFATIGSTGASLALDSNPSKAISSSKPKTGSKTVVKPAVKKSAPKKKAGKAKASRKARR